jgi:serine/threonine-protein kinase HipA
MLARYASYEDLASIVRHRFIGPRETLRELFSRMVFNVLCGNTDDHARNHAAFWDGRELALTPAYDICPQPRTGTEAGQAMLILGNERQSQLSLCLEAASSFLLKPAEARRIVKHQVDVVKKRWDAICDEANLSTTDRRYFCGRQFLNPFAFEGLPASLKT